MKKFAVIIPYFGKFKSSVSLFLNSCKRNPEIDWYIFTDCKIPDDVVLSCNIFWNNTTLENIRDLAEKKLSCEVMLKRPYKLCDLKPFYGLIFDEYIYNYLYWGYEDLDCINGRIMHFLIQIDFKKYDKINWMGHLSFIRNTKNCNRIMFENVEGTLSADKVLSTERNLGVDERDYNKKFLAKGLEIFTGKWAADIDLFYWRMRCVDLKTLHHLIDTAEIEYAPKNHIYQIFVVLDGKVFRIYLCRKKVFKEEFAYIHFRKEVPINLSTTNMDSFIISRTGFEYFNKDALNSYSKMKKIILRYNHQEGLLREHYTYFYHLYMKKSGKRGW